MRTRFLFRPLAALSLLGILTACAGGYTPPPAPAAPAATAPATGLAYTNPSTTGWALVQDASSTATHLVLNLVGPSGQQARGVGFNLASDGSVAFHRYADGNYVQDLGVFQLKLTTPNLYSTTYPNFYEPVLMVGGVKNGGKLLTVGLYQKDRSQPAQSFTPDKPVCQIGVDFSSAQASAVAAGSTIPLQLVRARIIPGDIGTQPADYTGDWTDVLNKFRMEDIQIAVGVLRAQ